MSNTTENQSKGIHDYLIFHGEVPRLIKKMKVKWSNHVRGKLEKVELGGSFGKGGVELKKRQEKFIEEKTIDTTYNVSKEGGYLPQGP